MNSRGLGLLAARNTEPNAGGLACFHSTPKIVFCCGKIPWTKQEFRVEHHSRVQVWQHPCPASGLGLGRGMLRHPLEGNHPRIRSRTPWLRLLYLLRAIRQWQPWLGHTPT